MRNKNGRFCLCTVVFADAACKMRYAFQKPWLFVVPIMIVTYHPVWLLMIADANFVQKWFQAISEWKHASVILVRYQSSYP